MYLGTYYREKGGSPLKIEHSTVMRADDPRYRYRLPRNHHRYLLTNIDVAAFANPEILELLACRERPAELPKHAKHVMP